ncbi:MAG: hypothetical protein LBN93_05505 [Candidatus Symbiothrix sp.]|jgi:hypothetical protein|nr:hypothetical protein [Candidatus Symbiothrix sp.]
MQMNIENEKRIVEKTSQMACGKAGALRLTRHRQRVYAEQLGAIITLRRTRSEAVEGGTKNSWFNQHPSRTDVTNSGARMEYVFGRSNGKVYIYNSNGVQAVIPMKQFVTPKR